MTEEEKPLHEIAWVRLEKQFGKPPCFDTEYLHLQSLKPRLLTLARAALTAFAIVLVGRWGHSELSTLATWLTGHLSFLKKYQILWSAIGLLVAVAFLPQFLRNFIRIWRWNKHRYGIPFVAILFNTLLFIFSSSYPTVTAWVAGATLFCFFYISYKPANVISTNTKDSFQRSYFVDRLMELFVKTETRLRRIAVLGTWGSGKTTVLKLLRERLAKSNSKKFRVAWVNPWTAKTPEEAHALIVQGFDNALSNSILNPTPNSRAISWSWLSGIKTAMGFGLTFDISRIIEDGSAATESAFLDRINRRLKEMDVSVVLLVDDMERAEPEVIRRIFPVIDRLGSIDHCFFVFAVDPDRVAKAFGEASRNAEETKGYLDKVFDLQIELPALRCQDLSALCKSLISSMDTPKLYAAWSQLADVIPDTPRQAIHFINDATTKETLFLSRYANDEPRHDFAGFFLLRILGIEIPGFFDQMGADTLRRYRDAKVTKEIMLSGDETSLDNIFNETWSELNTKFSIPESKKHRLNQVLKRVFNSSVDFAWATRYYMRLISPTAVQRAMLYNHWKINHGKESLLTMIEMAIPLQNFSDNEITAAELIDTEISGYDGLRLNLMRHSANLNYLEQSLSKATNSVQRLASQLEYGYAKRCNFDIQCFLPEYFQTWFQKLCGYPLSNIPGTKEIIELEYNFHILLSDRLSLKDRFRFSSLSIEEMAYQAHYDDGGNQHLPHLSSLKNYMQSRVRDEFLFRMESGTLTKPSLALDLGLEDIAHVFANPSCWLPIDGEDIIPVLSIKASSSDIFADSVVYIIHSILYTLGFILSSSKPGPSEVKIIEQIKANPNYFASFWKAAQLAKNSSEELHNLRSRVEGKRSTSGTFLLSKEDFDMAFPV